MEKPTLPKGTRDFGPAVMAKRQFIFDGIKKVFQKYGFLPLETPAMENLSTLQGKYGDEGDKLLFRVLDSGEFYEKLKSSERVTGQKLHQLENILYESILRLYKILKTKYPDLEPIQAKIVRDEIMMNRDRVETLIPNDASEENKSIIKKFLEQELMFIPYVALDILKRLKGEPDNSFSNEFNSVYGKDISFILADFLNNYYLNLLSSRSVIPAISEKGLRYDLTVPFARYVVMNRHEIAFPFKRYQVQPVWRADRPQKGRYREFYQCDADVVGTDSLLCEAEIILMIREVMANLTVSDFTIKINHRSVLNGIAEVTGAAGKETDLFVAIDKLDKIGEANVRKELIEKGFQEKQLDTLFAFLNQTGNNTVKLDYLTRQFTTSAAGQKGVEDLTKVLGLLNLYGDSDANVELDIALARGLSYYTGCIFEVKINNVSIGSVSGGGRYDKLTAAFGDKDNLSGVGFSFGVDRLYDALDELQLFPKETQVSSRVLICHFDSETMHYGLKVLSALRRAGIASELYPDQAKLKKQLDYANKKLVPFTIVVGSEEMKSSYLTFKNMESGEQEKLQLEHIIQKLK